MGGVGGSFPIKDISLRIFCTVKIWFPFSKCPIRQGGHISNPKNAIANLCKLRYIYKKSAIENFKISEGGDQRQFGLFQKIWETKW